METMPCSVLISGVPINSGAYDKVCARAEKSSLFGWAASRERGDLSLTTLSKASAPYDATHNSEANIHC
jgi:hypothetical protein